MKTIFSFIKADTKYDSAIRTFYLLFYAAGLIVWVALGLTYMTPAAWIGGLFCAALAATAYGTVANMIVGLIRKDRIKNRADTLIRLFFVLLFSVATVAFLAIGL